MDYDKTSFHTVASEIRSRTESLENLISILMADKVELEDTLEEMKGKYNLLEKCYNGNSKRTMDLEKYVEELESENKRLKRELEIYKIWSPREQYVEELKMENERLKRELEIYKICPVLLRCTNGTGTEN